MLSDTSLLALIVQADQCKPQQIANIMWAFGTLSYKPQEHLLNVLAIQGVSKLSDFNPQNLANFIWAYARYIASPSTVHRCKCTVHVDMTILELQQLIVITSGCNISVPASLKRLKVLSQLQDGNTARCKRLARVPIRV